MPPSPRRPPSPTLAGVSRRLAFLAVAALVLVVPVFFVPTALDAFRVPKLLLAEWLGLTSLLFLALAPVLAPEPPDRRPPMAWLRSPVVLAVAPLLAIATLSLATTAHSAHVARALPALWIGAACLVGWAWGFDRGVLGRCLELSVLAAAVLAVLGILQFHGLFQPFGFSTAHVTVTRLRVTSLAGNAGDFGGFLVLPCLLAQERAFSAFRGGAGRSSGRKASAWFWIAAVAVCFYGMAVSLTITALAALAMGSLLLWVLLLPRRRVAPVLTAALIVGAASVVLIAPLRSRVGEKLANVARGDLDALLTFRLDAWSAATWMLRSHPLAGVGHGAFAAEYTPAKIALLDQGRRFPDRGSLDTSFANAHNDVLEVGAELGVPGLLALALGLFVLLRQARRDAGGEADEPAALRWAGLAALAVLALASFPFETALIAYPWLLFVAWVFASAASPSAAPVPESANADRKAARTGKRRRRS